MGGRINAYFVCGGKYHDIDFARIEILKLLNEKERIRVRMAETYHDIAAITASDFLITYTVDVTPTAEEQAAIDAWLAAGGRWFALHGTNAILRIEDGLCKAPRDEAPALMRMLGSQFVAHPPVGPFTVEVVEPDHPLVEGIPPRFEVIDELYLSEIHPGNRVLLQTHFNGMAEPGFEELDWQSDDPRPVMYLRDHGAGELLYLTLGHRRGRYDMEPVTADYPKVDPGAWIQPAFYELLRRGIEWGGRTRPVVHARTTQHGGSPMSEDINREVVRRHLDAWRRGDVPALLADYSDDAVMLSAASGPLAGKPAIGAMFAQVFETVFRPEDTTLDVTAEIAAGDTVLVHWTATTTAIRTVGGFDVFTMRDGKIAVQCGGAEIVARD